jgi:hypothetical protein
MAHTIAILGSGKIGRGKTVTAVEELVDSVPHDEGNEPAFLFPVLHKITPAQQYVAEWAADLSYKFTWLLGPDSEATISDTLLDGAAEILDSTPEDFADDIVNEVKKDGRILLAWDDSEAEDHEALIRIVSAEGIKTYDLTTGLEELVLDDDTDQLPEGDEPEITIEHEPLTSEDMLSDDWESVTMKPWLRKIREALDSCRDEINAVLSDALQQAWEDGHEVGVRDGKRLAKQAKERATA